MIEDGFTSPVHCENVDAPADREADAPALYCEATKPDTHLSADCDAIRRHFDNLSNQLSQAARHVIGD